MLLKKNKIYTIKYENLIFKLYYIPNYNKWELVRSNWGNDIAHIKTATDNNLDNLIKRMTKHLPGFDRCFDEILFDEHLQEILCR